MARPRKGERHCGVWSARSRAGPSLYLTSPWPALSIPRHSDGAHIHYFCLLGSCDTCGRSQACGRAGHNTCKRAAMPVFPKVSFHCFRCDRTLRRPGTRRQPATPPAHRPRSATSGCRPLDRMARRLIRSYSVVTSPFQTSLHRIRAHGALAGAPDGLGGGVHAVAPPGRCPLWQRRLPCRRAAVRGACCGRAVLACMHTVQNRACLELSSVECATPQGASS